MARDSLAVQAVLSAATSLSREGKYTEAESMITSFTSGAKALPAALDLLARIRSQQGRLSDAEALWKHALQLDPDNQDFMAGLMRIARIQKRSTRKSIGVFLVLGIIGLLVVWLVGIIVNTQINRFRISLVNEMQTVLKAPSTTSPPKDANFLPTIREESRSAHISIQVPGIIVEPQVDNVLLKFQQGLFQSGAQLTPIAERVLSELAKNLKPQISGQIIQVIGCSDDRTVRPGGLFSDNTSLRMARAVAVVDYLRRSEGLEKTSFVVKYPDRFNDPFPNTSEGDRLRNRSVIILISTHGESKE